MDENTRLSALQKIAQDNSYDLLLPSKQEIRDTYNANAFGYSRLADELNNKAKWQSYGGKAVGTGGTVASGMVAGAGLKQMTQGRGNLIRRPGVGKVGGGLLGIIASLFSQSLLERAAEENRKKAVGARQNEQKWKNGIRHIDSAPTKQDSYGRTTQRM